MCACPPQCAYSAPCGCSWPRGHARGTPSSACQRRLSAACAASRQRPGPCAACEARTAPTAPRGGVGQTGALAVGHVGNALPVSSALCAPPHAVARRGARVHEPSAPLVAPPPPAVAGPNARPWNAKRAPARSSRAVAGRAGTCVRRLYSAKRSPVQRGEAGQTRARAASGRTALPPHRSRPGAAGRTRARGTAKREPLPPYLVAVRTGQERLTRTPVRSRACWTDARAARTLRTDTWAYARPG